MSSNHQVIIPQTMRAALVTGYGDAKDVVKVSNTVPVPKISRDNQVLIKVRAASINPLDNKIISGALQAVFKRELPYIPGIEVAGVIVDVGSSVKKLKIGDSVHGRISIDGAGTIAEYAVLPENNLAIISNQQSFPEAAGVPAVGAAAYQALIKHGELQEDQRVLILGGSGGAGHVGIQIAKSIKGTYVATTGSPTSQLWLQSLGADKFIDKNDPHWVNQFTDEKQKFHIVFDTVGGLDQWEKAQKVLLPDGKFITIVPQPPSKQVEGDKRFKLLLSTPDDSDVNNSLTKLIDEKKLRIHIEKTYELSQIVEALTTSLAGHVKGKLIIHVSDN